MNLGSLQKQVLLFIETSFQDQLFSVFWTSTIGQVVPNNNLCNFLYHYFKFFFLSFLSFCVSDELTLYFAVVPQLPVVLYSCQSFSLSFFLLCFKSGSFYWGKHNRGYSIIVFCSNELAKVIFISLTIILIFSGFFLLLFICFYLL